jgi:hypothetical protein
MKEGKSCADLAQQALEVQPLAAGEPVEDQEEVTVAVERT